NGVILFYLLLCFLYLVYHQIFHYLGTLVTHSAIIDYNFIELLKTHSFSLLFVLIYCINIVSLVLLTDFILYLGKGLCHNSSTHILNIQLFVLVQFLILSAVFDSFDLVNVLIGLIVLIRSFDHAIFRENRVSTHVISLVSLALITAIIFSKSYNKAQEKQLKQTISLLKSNDDPEAIVQFDSIESDLLSDDHLLKILHFSYPDIDGQFLSSYIKRKYLNGYRSKYDFQGYYYLNTDPIEKYTSNKITDYREKVINSTKINSTSNFYKHATEIGKLEYFAILKIPLSAEDELTLILNFTNKVFSQALPFPILLGANNNDAQLSEQNFGENSYAFYKNGTLITQNGKYIYPNTDASFPQAIEEYIVLKEDNRFTQVMYRPNSYTT